MNIDEIPPSKLQCGCVMSVLDCENLVVETFTNGQEKITVVFWNGIPIPLTMFMFYLGVRMAPKATRKYFPINRIEKNIIQLSFEEITSLRYTWSRVPARDFTRAIMMNNTVTDVIHGIVQFFFSHFNSGNTPAEARKMLAEFIKKLDEDHSSSLIEPRFVGQSSPVEISTTTEGSVINSPIIASNDSVKSSEVNEYPE